MQMNKLVESGKKQVRLALTTACPKAKAAQVDRLVVDIGALLIKRFHSPSDLMQGVMVVVGNIEALGDKAAGAQPSKLLQELDEEELAALIEADVDERHVESVFGQSETCDVCGLPKSSGKFNLNRMDVEDEVLGQQFDAVFNDSCRCIPGVTDNTKVVEEEEAKKPSGPAEKGSILSLFEEQDAEDKKEEASVAAAEKKDHNKLPDRRGRQDA